MNHDQEKTLEQLLSRELKQLPDLPAPGTLVHRVMLAVHQRQSLPWYRRAWPTWPAGLQIASILVLAVLAGALIAVVVHPSLIPGWESAGRLMAEWTDPLAVIWAKGEALFNGLSVAMNTVGRQLILFGLLFVLLGYLCSVALLTACYRLAAKRIL